MDTDQTKVLIKRLKREFGSSKRYLDLFIFRLYKDIIYYEKEIVDFTAKLNKMIEDSEDESRIKQQQACIQESKDMIPLVTQKLKVSVDNLTLMVTSAKTNAEITSTNCPELEQAIQLLKQVKTILPSKENDDDDD